MRAAVELRLGLIVQNEFAVLDRLAQGRFELQPGRYLGIHLRGKETEGVASRVLGPVHRRVRVFHQGLGVRRILGVHRDADAGGHGHLVAFQVERRAQRTSNLVGDAGRALMDSDADAGGHRHLMAFHLEGRAHRIVYLVGNEHCTLLAVCITRIRQTRPRSGAQPYPGCARTGPGGC